MKKWAKIPMIMLGSLLLFCLTNDQVHAEEKTVESMVHYGVKPIFPENQIDKSLVYFNLRMEPNQKQTVEIEVKNTDEKPLDIEVNANAAFTSLTGVINYIPESKELKFDKTLTHPFAKLASVQNKITVPANQVITVPVTIAMPTEKVKGTILGGIEFIQSTPTEDPAKDKKSSGGMAIRNKYRYVIPVKISESDEKVKPEMKLNKVKASQVSFKNVISANLQNTKPMILNDMRVESKVTRAGSDKVLYKNDKVDMQMAPNSNFDYPIEMGTKPFKPGKYTLYLVVTTKEGKWQFKKDFTISREEANKYNKESVIELDKSTNWLLISLIILGILVIVGILIWVIIRQRKKNKLADKSTKEKSKSTAQAKSKSSENSKKKKKKRKSSGQRDKK